MIYCVLFLSISTLAKSRNEILTCTMDINQYGHPSNCSCSTGQRYEYKNGKCIVLTLSQKRAAFESLLIETTSVVAILRNEYLKSRKTMTGKKLLKHLEVIGQEMKVLAKTDELDAQILHKIKKEISSIKFQLEVCQSERLHDCIGLLDKLRILITQLKYD